ncbi:MAG: signal recognition particle protein [Thermovirgaceae bacterium]
MFDSLRNRLESVFGKLRDRGKLTEQDVTEAAREVRRALLEGDVNYKVVKDLVGRIRERALGKAVLESITPAQQVQAIVFEEMTELMGGKTRGGLDYASQPPTRCLLVGLQGAGKTTSCVKIAKNISGRHKPLVVACDLKRPAAVQQLSILADQENIGFYGPEPGEKDVVSLVKRADEYARQRLYDVLLFDTAGRLHMDEDLMKELEDLKRELQPREILLVLDAMTGQEAVDVAKAFHERLGLSGLVMTKLDGDARGGALLSARAVAEVPVKFVGTGERTEDLEAFDAGRMAQRILGMGDVAGLAEKVRQAAEGTDVEEMAKSLRKGRFDMSDLLQQIRQLRKMGPLDKVIEMVPGANRLKGLADTEVDQDRIKRIEAVILSMTPEERRNPKIIKGSRRRRIAKGSGTTVQAVNQVLAQHKQMQELMKRFGKGGKRMKLPGGFPF